MPSTRILWGKRSYPSVFFNFTLQTALIISLLDMNIEDSAAILTVPLYLLESTLVLLVILLTLKLKNNWLIFGLLLTFFSLPYFLSCPLLSPFSKTSKSSFLVWKLVLVLNFFNSFLHFEQDILLVKKHNRQLLCLYLIFNFTKPLK